MNKLWSAMAKRANPYIPGEQLNKTNIIKLNTNENPYPPSPKVMDAIQKEVNEDLRLYPAPAADNLRLEIAKYYHVNKDNVFVGNGSDEVLAFSFMAFFNPDKPIFFPAISYSFYPVYAKVFNIPYKAIPLKNDFTIEAHDYYDAEGGVIFPNPNAPTSIHLPLEKVEEIIQHNENNIVIIDEAYIDFAGENTSAVSLIEKYDNVLVIQTMSKSRSLAGLRVGFALGNEQLIQALIHMKDSFNSYPIDRLAMAGATAAIQDTAYFEESTQKIIKTREQTKQALIKKGFHVLPSSANFLFVSHPNIDAASLYEEMRKKDILIRYFGKHPISNYVRISIGTDEEMHYFLKGLDEIMTNA